MTRPDAEPALAVVKLRKAILSAIPMQSPDFRTRAGPDRPRLAAPGLWRWRGGWRIAAAPAMVMSFVVLRIVVDTARDPTSRNLWPFES